MDKEVKVDASKIEKILDDLKTNNDDNSQAVSSNEKELNVMEISEDDIKYVLNMDIEELFRNPSHAILLHKFLGTIIKESKEDDFIKPAGLVIVNEVGKAINVFFINNSTVHH
ncbi:hypothetical protein TSUD_260450 [Trifolium subterraneum]|uniref:Uncharacterized protein n=1 Tax=Trifolium subterraneum TaxID=3900 RepID=A0A2Z6M0L5_TRISU|nr:hypothetical protein TSUD_260450 [Trifolium subterraneum]